MWHTRLILTWIGRGLFHSLESRLKRAERLVDQSIDLDPLVQRPLPAMERPLPRDASLTYLRLTRGGLDPLDKLAKLPLEVVEVERADRV